MPVITLSIYHVNNPIFAYDYYEAILGVYATYGKSLGRFSTWQIRSRDGSTMLEVFERNWEKNLSLEEMVIW